MGARSPSRPRYERPPGQSDRGDLVGLPVAEPSTSNGVYLAPAVAGTDTVIATSVADLTKTGVATVNAGTTGSYSRWQRFATS